MLSTKTIENFSRLADLLEEASRLARNLSKSDQVTNNFWAECAELRDAFADLSEEEVDRLVSEAVKGVRAEQTMLQT